MRYVLDRMALGVTRDEVPSLEGYVLNVLTSMDEIFHQQGISHRNLPAPSREAYDFFRSIHRKGISATGRRLREKSGEPSTSTDGVRVDGVVRAVKSILHEVSILLDDEPLDEIVERISPRLAAEVDRIKTVCARFDASPENLPLPSRRAYSMMAFLNTDVVLPHYIETTAAIKEAIVRFTDTPAIAKMVRLDEIGGIYRYRLRDGNCFFRISPGVMAGDDAAIELVVRDALLDPDPVVRKGLHEFCHSDGFCSIVQEIEEIAAPPHQTVGTVYDLAVLCDKVRERYFDGTLSPPAALGWSDQRTYHTFGYYSVLRDRITISRSLDDKLVPKYAVEFVMYHELLHKKHGIGFATQRRTMHTTAFRADERRFPRYDDARTFLNQWSAKVRRRTRR
jgi:hypothetical protein